MNQIELHNQIDSLIEERPESIEKEVLNECISVNKDAYKYFYSIATESWLGWLWDNGFLDKIKKESKDKTFYKYRMPELNYLVRISKKSPEKVVDVMLENKVATSEDNFNPEVVDRFLWICGKLPADQIERIVPKIKDQSWPKLMGGFHDRGFEYKEMLETLSESGKYESIIKLADALLETRSRKEIEEDESSSFKGTPFYFKNLSYTEVFHYLSSIDKENLEEALSVVSNKISKIVGLGEKFKESKNFEIKDMFHLFDTDFFAAKPSKDPSRSVRDDVDQLFAVFKELTRRALDNRCNNIDYVEKVYSHYINKLPNSRVVWRFKMFALSLCPKVFKEKLKESFFRLFDTEDYHELMSGAEYEKALKDNFKILDEKDKKDFIGKTIEYFTKINEESDDKEDWHLKYGSRILSILKKAKQLPKDKEEEVKDRGFEINIDYEPKPTISSGGYAREIQERGPVSSKEFSKLSIEGISEKMKSKWTPEKLRKSNKTKDFHYPRNAEGLGRMLRSDIKERFNEYIKKSSLFFDKDNLDPHYTYSFVRGVEEVLKNKELDFSDVNWQSLIEFCHKVTKEIDDSNLEKRKRGKYDTFLTNWGGVFQAISDIIRELVDDNNEKVDIEFSKYRDDLLLIIKNLLKSSNPGPEDDTVRTTSMKEKSPGSDSYTLSDPFTRAINSVRGRTFQVLVLFVYRDGEELKEDVRDIYENVLYEEDTQPLMLLFGYYLPTFYFRDKGWVHGMLNEIFPEEEDKKDLFFASWEGYLANKIYEEIFTDSKFQDLYKKAIDLDPDTYTKRKYYRDLDKGLAIHLALAFMHYEDFDFEDKLYKKFWSDSNIKQKSEFISFLGRRYVSGDNVIADSLLKNEEYAKERLEKFWDKVLKEQKEKELFKGFGYWIDSEKGRFDLEWLAEHVKNTISKTNGKFGWNYGLQKSICDLAKVSPENALKILELYFVDGFIGSGDDSRRPFLSRENWLEAFEILYKNDETKEETYKLIDKLIEKGGSTFWQLKEIFKDE